MRKIFKIIIACLLLISCSIIAVACNDLGKNHEHEYTWTTVLEATCTTEGIKKGDCSCGFQTIEDINKTEHIRDNKGICIFCGDINLENHQHEFIWTTVLEATCTEIGVKRGSCICGYYENKVINATGHNRNNYGECIICGDGKIDSIDFDKVLSICDKFGIKFTDNGSSIDKIVCDNNNNLYISVSLDGVFVDNICIGDLSVNYKVEVSEEIAYISKIFIENGHLIIVTSDGLKNDCGIISDYDTSEIPATEKLIDSVIINKENLFMIIYNDNSIEVIGKIKKRELISKKIHYFTNYAVMVMIDIIR